LGFRHDFTSAGYSEYLGIPGLGVKSSPLELKNRAGCSQKPAKITMSPTNDLGENQPTSS
jgi:hypothetical protein